MVDHDNFAKRSFERAKRIRHRTPSQIFEKQAETPEKPRSFDEAWRENKFKAQRDFNGAAKDSQTQTQKQNTNSGKNTSKVQTIQKPPQPVLKPKGMGGTTKNLTPPAKQNSDKEKAQRYMDRHKAIQNRNPPEKPVQLKKEFDKSKGGK